MDIIKTWFIGYFGLDEEEKCPKCGKTLKGYSIEHFKGCNGPLNCKSGLPHTGKHCISCGWKSEHCKSENFKEEKPEIITIGEKKKTCNHLIKAEWGRDYSKPQTNALRVEVIELQDRCALKMPDHWNRAARERAHIDILNGFILDFGPCCAPCPKHD